MENIPIASGPLKGAKAGSESNTDFRGLNVNAHLKISKLVCVLLQYRAKKKIKEENVQVLLCDVIKTVPL